MEFEIEVNDDEFTRIMRRIIGGMEQPADLFRMFSETLVDRTAQNFADQGNPAWQALSEVTIAKRKKAGTWPGKILIVSAGLSNSVTGDHGDDFAVVGSNKVYAAIQHLGGQAGRGKKVTVPARPYFPMDKDGALQPEIVPDLHADVDAYLRSLVEG